MKRILMVLFLVVLAVSAVQAQGLYVIPSASVDLGIGNYFRGGAAACQAVYDFGLAVGLEVKADYDTLFNVFNVPVLLTIGIGRGFWIGAGYTIAAGSPYLLANDGSHVPWKVGAFPLPDTYEIGANLFSIPVGIGNLTFPTTISYTMNQAVTNDAAAQAVSQLFGVFFGLKATIGIGLEIKPF
jgi:hypothetical protein